MPNWQADENRPQSGDEDLRALLVRERRIFACTFSPVFQELLPLPLNITFPRRLQRDPCGASVSLGLGNRLGRLGDTEVTCPTCCEFIGPSWPRDRHDMPCHDHRHLDIYNTRMVGHFFTGRRREPALVSHFLSSFCKMVWPKLSGSFHIFFYHVKDVKIVRLAFLNYIMWK